VDKMTLEQPRFTTIRVHNALSPTAGVPELVGIFTVPEQNQIELIVLNTEIRWEESAPPLTRSLGTDPLSSPVTPEH
jgi:hypothetical protein